MVNVRKVIALFCVVSLVMGMAGTLWASEEKININKASEEELQQLKMIGEVIAKRIVEYRKENGSFESPEDIMNVKGIGDKVFELNKDRIVVTKSKSKKKSKKKK
ncbi:MAG: helix-hairpin-helix domain-containing protein [Desulfobacteraceae bacterium]|nr:helix-hairpin-helix domain-containing protein [Desulfobacteraceae bacterium]